MTQADREKVITNYYKATSALMEIGIAESIPEELRWLAIDASAKATMIIDYINSHKE